MGYRFCHRCGWLKTDEYTVDENGETICPVHQMKTSGFREEEPDNYERGYNRQMVVNSDYEIPTCYFCEKTSGWFRENRLHVILVQAIDEEPEEAQTRRVCKECDPKR